MKNRLKKISFTLLALLLVLIIFDKVLMPWYVSSEEVTVPNFVGMDKNRAQEMLEALNLEPVIIGPKYDNNNPLPKDHILRQRPHSGMKVKIGRRIYLFYSGGSPKVTMPDLFGKTYREADVILNNLDLKIGEITQSQSEYPSNTIIEQQYAFGALLEKGTTVNLTVSTGDKLGFFRTPDLAGLTLNEAKEKLSEFSLVIGRIEYQESSSLLPNTIISQNPEAESLVAPYDTITVIISKSKRR